MEKAKRNKDLAGIHSFRKAGPQSLLPGRTDKRLSLNAVNDFSHLKCWQVFREYTSYQMGTLTRLPKSTPNLVFLPSFSTEMEPPFFSKASASFLSIHCYAAVLKLYIHVCCEFKVEGSEPERDGLTLMLPSLACWDLKSLKEFVEEKLSGAVLLTGVHTAFQLCLSIEPEGALTSVPSYRVNKCGP